MARAGYQVYDSILDVIGGTPVVRINRLAASRPDVEVYAKLEGFNPTGSVKDRIALNMIEKAEQEGVLKPGDTIIEATSGNTGIGLAMVGAVKGYKVVLCLCEAVSVERRKFLAAFGAEILLTPEKEWTDGAIRKCQQMLADHPGKFFNPNQFSNINNRLAHYEHTGEEIWAQSGGRITHFVAALGTSGTIGGTAKKLREKNPNIRVIEAHPVRGHKIQGLKNMAEAIVPAIYEPDAVDERYFIETERAYEVARRIVAEEGIFVGMSSGAAMAGVLEVLPNVPSGSVIFTIFPDRGEKYLSTALFPYTDPPLPGAAPA
jgi:cysteine synthase